MKQLIETLKTASNGVLSEAVITEIARIFNEQVEAAVKDKVALAVETAILQNDAENLKLFKEAVIKLDRDRAAKMTHLLLLSEKNKVKAVENEKKRTQKYLKEDAKKFKEELIARIDAHIEKNIKDAIPAELIKEAALNTQARKLVKNLRNTLAVDEATALASVQKEITAAKEEAAKAKTALAAKEAEVIKLTESTKTISAQLGKQNKALLIESKISGFDAKKKDAMRMILSEKTEQQINENFKFIDQQYEANAKREAQRVLDEKAAAAKEFRVSKTSVKTGAVMTESAKTQAGIVTPVTESVTDADKCADFMRPPY